MGLKKLIKSGAKKIAKGTEIAAKAAYDISPAKQIVKAGESAVKGDLGGTIQGMARTLPGINLGVMAGKKLAEEGAAKKATAQTVVETPTVTPAPTPTTVPKAEPIGSLANSQFLPEEYKRALAAREAGLAGFSAPELAAQRAEMGSQVGAAEAQRKRELASALARSGVKGGAAAAMQARTAQQAATEQGKLAQDLFIRDIMQKQAAQSAYEQSLGGAMKAAGGQQFMQLAPQIAEAQLASGEKIAQMGAGAVEKYGQSVANQPQPASGFLSNLFGGLFG